MHAAALGQEAASRETEMALELAANSDFVLPRLFETLVTRNVASEGGEPQPLSLESERVILRALQLMDPEQVTSYLQHELGTRLPDRRRAVVQFLGAVGRGTEILRLLGIAITEEETKIDSSMARATREAITSILVRDPVAFGVLEGSFPALRSETLPLVVEALGATADQRAFGFLCLAARAHKNLRRLVLDQVPAVGGASEDALNIEMRGYARATIRRDLPECQSAIRAAATLRDAGSIPALIMLFNGEHDDLEVAAAAALREMTGMAFESRTGWTRWYEAERAWMVAERAAAFQKLYSSDHRQVSEALDSIAPHALVRDEFLSVLGDLLRTRPVEIRLLVCRAFQESGAREGIGELVLALKNESSSVVAAAHHALQSLTGRDLPLDPELWSNVARELDCAGGKR